MACGLFTLILRLVRGRRAAGPSTRNLGQGNSFEKDLTTCIRYRSFGQPDNLVSVLNLPLLFARGWCLSALSEPLPVSRPGKPWQAFAENAWWWHVDHAVSLAPIPYDFVYWQNRVEKYGRALLVRLRTSGIVLLVDEDGGTLSFINGLSRSWHLT